jgi:hypothetical protein
MVSALIQACIDRDSTIAIVSATSCARHSQERVIGMSRRSWALNLRSTSIPAMFRAVASAREDVLKNQVMLLARTYRPIGKSRRRGRPEELS